MDQRITSVSTIDKDKSKSNGEIKNSETSSPIIEEENPENNQKNEKGSKVANDKDTSLIINEKKFLDKNNEIIDKKAIEINNTIRNENINVRTDEIFLNENSEMKNNEVQNGNIFVISNAFTDKTNNEDVNEMIYVKNNDAVFEKKYRNNDSEEELKDEIKEENKEEKKRFNNISSSQLLVKENIIHKKEDKTNKSDLKNIFEGISNKPKNEILEISKYNKDKIETNNSLEDILEFIKKKLDSSKVDEKKEKEKDDIVNIIMPIFQRHNRYFRIINQLNISKSTIKEIESFQLIQRKINEDKFEIGKCLIEINRMKLNIESLGIPSIINVKRKILVLLIFSLLKLNKDKFNLDKNYCPNKGFLDKILEKLDNYSKNMLRKNELEKIDQYKKDINKLINKNKTIIEFPFSCSDNTLDNIMRYLWFCKGKYNRIVHISKEALKYYLNLSINSKLDPKFKELFNIFIDYGKDKTEKNKFDKSYQNKIKDEEDNGKDEKEINSINEKPLKIEFDTALDFFLKHNIGIEQDGSKFEKKLEEIESKKNFFLDKYSDCVNDGWKHLLDLYDKFDNINKIDNKMSIFYPEEIKLIKGTTEDFEDTLKALEVNLLELKEIKDEVMIKELINQFFSKYHQITQKELDFDSGKYLYLCETVKGRYLLVFFQIQLIKYQLLDLYSKKFAKILNDFYEINKSNIMEQLLELKNQSSNLVDEMKKINNIKSPKKMFMEWKFSRCIIIKDDFESFIKRIKSYISSIEFKFNEDLISDQVTSLWLIKNDLDKYVD